MQTSARSPCFSAALDLERHGAVGFAKMRAPFAMPDFDQAGAAVLEHQWRNLTGPRSLVLPMHVLRANFHTRPFEYGCNIGDIGIGRNDKGCAARSLRPAKTAAFRQKPAPRPVSCSSSSLCRSTEPCCPSVVACLRIGCPERHGFAHRVHHLRSAGSRSRKASSRHSSLSAPPPALMASSSRSGVMRPSLLYCAVNGQCPPLFIVLCLIWMIGDCVAKPWPTRMGRYRRVGRCHIAMVDIDHRLEGSGRPPHRSSPAKPGNRQSYVPARGRPTWVPRTASLSPRDFACSATSRQQSSPIFMISSPRAGSSWSR